jgi:hypothetical protein
VSQYDGLNLPQLLDLMHGLVMPEPVPWLPQTPGWWIVLGWLLAVLLLAVWQLVRRRRRNRYRRDALAELDAITVRQDMDPAVPMSRRSMVVTGRDFSASPPTTTRRLPRRPTGSRPRLIVPMRIPRRWHSLHGAG